MRQSAIFLTALTGLGLAISAHGQARQPCMIVRVIDSCRVELASGETVRLIGLQKFPNSPPNLLQSIFLFDSLVVGKSLWLEHDENLPLDFGYLWRDSLLINAELLKCGLARLSPDTVEFRYREIFFAAETGAKAAQRGYWALVPLDSTRTTIFSPENSVYVTPSGQKYHQLGCRFLSEKKIAMPLSKARLEYSPCRLCIESEAADGNMHPRQSEQVSTRQCAAKTKSGARCKRRAEPGSDYCWQHRQK